MAEDIGDTCIYCFKDTSFGSGRFVNRIPADDGEHDGYACAECMQMECDRCDDMIGLDEDYKVNGGVFHRHCLTLKEYEAWCLEEGIDTEAEPYDENDMGDNSTTSHNFNAE